MQTRHTGDMHDFRSHGYYCVVHRHEFISLTFNAFPLTLLQNMCLLTSPASPTSSTPSFLFHHSTQFFFFFSAFQFFYSNTSGHVYNDIRLLLFHVLESNLDKVSVMRFTIPMDLSTRSFIPLPRFFHSRRAPPLLTPSLVLFPQRSA